MPDLFRKMTAFCLLGATILLLCACGQVPEIELPPLPTYSAETPAPAANEGPGAEPSTTPKPVESPAISVPSPEVLSPSPALIEDTPAPAPVITPEPNYPIISIREETLPEDMVQYNVATLHGVVSTNKGNLSKISAVLLDSEGNVVQSCNFEPMQANFSLAGTVNAELQFALLTPGDYVYVLYADADYEGNTVQRELIYHEFTVFSSLEQMKLDAVEEEFNFTAKVTQDKSNAGIIWNFLIAYLNNPYGAAGVLANIEIESNCDPARVQGDFSEGYSFSLDYTARVDEGDVSKESFVNAIAADGFGSGYGICQWSFERKEGLYELAKENGVSVSDLDTQCTYLIMELEMKYPELSRLLKSTDDARQAAREFCYVFEQAGEIGDRAGIAEDFLIRFAS